MSIHATADVAASALVDPTATVWHNAQVREGASIGGSVIIGRGAYIGTGVHIGANSKVQNYALVYEPAEVAQGVFIGPAVILTNDRNPRAITPDGQQQTSADWDAVGVRIREGASIGARAVCVAPVTIGRWAMVGAGAVVTDDVPDFGLVVGVPARQVGWVGRSGVRLMSDVDDPSLLTCPDTGSTFRLIDGSLIEEK